MKLSRQYAVDELNRMGYAEQADEALRVLPDPIDTGQLQTWAIQHGEAFPGSTARALVVRLGTW